MSDAKGYYARLGVSSTATAAEIKAAFRRLAKETHPDRSGESADGDKFRALVEAYETLSDPASRARYDSLGATRQSGGPDRHVRFEPIRCSACNQITAQPRYIVFRNVMSFLIVTLRNPVQGIYCSACARQAALKSTLFSSLAGWWGVPWGPVFTVVEGLRNAAGGDALEQNEDRLLLHNAIAFMQRGDWKLALGLAQRIEFSSDPEIANEAKRLIGLLNGRGVQEDNRLKNPWSFNLGHFAAHLLLIAAIPALVVLMVTLSSGRSYPSAPGETPASEFAFNEQSIEFNEQLAAIGPDANVASFAPEPTCANPPASGQRLSGRRLSGAGHRVEIENGASGDAIIKIRDADTGRLVISFFAAQNTTAGIQGLRDGRYTIQYAFGPALAADCRSFASISSASEFPGTETLATEERQEALGTRIIRQRLRYTLYSVPDGNVQPVPLDAGAFNRD